VGYWCADTAPRGISAANHPGGVYAEAQRGFKYKNPAGAIVHSWMPHHWYTYMFEVRRSVDVPGSAKPAQTYPGTNAIFGKCATPNSCVAGIQQVAGNVSTLGSCQALVNKVRTAQRPLPSTPPKCGVRSFPRAARARVWPSHHR